MGEWEANNHEDESNNRDTETAEEVRKRTGKGVGWSWTVRATHNYESCNSRKRNRILLAQTNKSRRKTTELIYFLTLSWWWKFLMICSKTRATIVRQWLFKGKSELPRKPTFIQRWGFITLFTADPTGPYSEPIPHNSHICTLFV